MFSCSQPALIAPPQLAGLFVPSSLLMRGASHKLLVRLDAERQWPVKGYRVIRGISVAEEFTGVLLHVCAVSLSHLWLGLLVETLLTVTPGSLFSPTARCAASRLLEF